MAQHHDVWKAASSTLTSADGIPTFFFFSIQGHVCGKACRPQTLTLTTLNEFSSERSVSSAKAGAASAKG